MGSHAKDISEAQRTSTCQDDIEQIRRFTLSVFTRKGRGKSGRRLNQIEQQVLCELIWLVAYKTRDIMYQRKFIAESKKLEVGHPMPEDYNFTREWMMKSHPMTTINGQTAKVDWLAAYIKNNPDDNEIVTEHKRERERLAEMIVTELGDDL